MYIVSTACVNRATTIFCQETDEDFLAFAVDLVQVSTTVLMSIRNMLLCIHCMMHVGFCYAGSCATPCRFGHLDRFL